MIGKLESFSRVAWLALVPLAGCASSREGWGRGRYVALLEEPFLQVRRARQVVDLVAGDLVAAWVGARATEGESDIVSCELVLFVDRDRDGQADADEIRVHRESRERARKVLFDDVRIPADGSAGEVMARLDVRTERKGRTVTWAFARD